MSFNEIIRKEPGRAYMLANEAIVRYALEADVKVVSFYPGAPQTEILDNFERALEYFDFQMEIAANEKVALETAAGAAMVGVRSLTSMKSVGMNVASDALYSLAYTGVRGGCVCIIADDPHAHSSQSEQDGRWFGYTSYLPMLEPSNPQEAAEMVKYAFELSEQIKNIVLIRTTTRVNHQSGIVRINEMQRTPFKKISWKSAPKNYVTVGELARAGKLKLIKMIDSLKETLADSPLNRLEYFDGKKLIPLTEIEKSSADLGIITAGVSYNYAIEGLMRLNSPAFILKLGILNPFPQKIVSEFLKHLKKVVVVEELSPYIENFVTAAAKKSNPEVEIIGKLSGDFPEALEYNVPIVVKALARTIGKRMPFDYEGHFNKISKLADILPLRLPVFCAGCPHRATIWALRRAVGDPKRIFLSNDIGCYSMMSLPPIEWSNSLLCMGASMGIAAGVQHATDDKVVAIMGDSTLFHAALPGIINAVHNRDNITFFVLDNAVTAMTGQQTHPGHPNRAGGKPGKRLDIETLLRGLGVEKIININAFSDVKKNVVSIKEALKYEGVSAVISHGECALYHFRNYRHAGGKIVPYYVDKNVCEKAYACILYFMCPALSVGEDGKAEISEDLCVGCGVCAQLCPHDAIKSTALNLGGENRPYTTLEDYRALEKIIHKPEGG